MLLSLLRKLLSIGKAERADVYVNPSNAVQPRRRRLRQCPSAITTLPLANHHTQEKRGLQRETKLYLGVPSSESPDESCRDLKTSIR